MLSFIAPLAFLATSAQAEPAAQAPEDWVAIADEIMAKQKAKSPISKPAKNVILFVADGMDPTTVTASRIYEGQQLGKLGEEHMLTFESLPWVGLSKTYNTNMQTPDSAGTATAMLTGEKTISGVINVNQMVKRGDCASSMGKELPSMMDFAHSLKRSVGVVSTARITHATPATVYANAADRNWENDSDLPSTASECKDIASQLIDAARDDKLVLALGGGRANFMPDDAEDPENKGKTGDRLDGRDLTQEWQDLSRNATFIWNKEQFDALKPGKKDLILGLFERSHMQYDADRADDTAGEPSIAEMTEFAINRLSKDKDGFFLLVEGGRVDHAHHAGNAARALQDVVAFDAAIEKALDMTDAEDTLIIVTADHGHTLHIQGYSHRGNPILGLAKALDGDGNPSNRPIPAADGKPYTTLGYGNGPGSVFARSTADGPSERPFIGEDEATNIDYRQQSLIPSLSETHGGQDVTIYARGPMAHLLNGVVEQHFIYHVMKEAFAPSEDD